MNIDYAARALIDHGIVELNSVFSFFITWYCHVVVVFGSAVSLRCIRLWIRWVCHTQSARMPSRHNRYETFSSDFIEIWKRMLQNFRNNLREICSNYLLLQGYYGRMLQPSPLPTVYAHRATRLMLRPCLYNNLYLAWPTSY